MDSGWEMLWRDILRFLSELFSTGQERGKKELNFKVKNKRETGAGYRECNLRLFLYSYFQVTRAQKGAYCTALTECVKVCL